MKRNILKGQSILEYTLVIGAVLAVIIAVLLGGGGTSVKGQINATYSKASSAINATQADADQGIFKP